MRAIGAEALGARTRVDTILLHPLPRLFGDDRLHSELLELLELLNSSALSPPQRPSDLIGQLGSLG
jgi:hypothetical protein